MVRFLLSSCLVLIFMQVNSQPERSTKRGIAYGNHNEADLMVISQGISWWYNWYHQPETAVASLYQKYNLEFVPMTWNNNFNESGLRAFYTAHPEVKYLLAFNEPNFLEQANMTPSQVASAWPRLEAIAKDFGLKIVGPAVNWCGSCVSEGGVSFTNPYAYLDSFFNHCEGCQVDFIAVHNYMCYTSALKDYIEGFKKYGKKIWLTEFACWDQQSITLSMQKNLMKGAIDYLENDTMVYRYAWFTGNRSGAFPYLDIYAPTRGVLTELGKFYVNYKAWIPDTNFYFPLPGRIEAEYFVSMKGISTETTTDFDGWSNIGGIDGSDWMEYNIEVQDSQEYYFYLRHAGISNTKIIVSVNNVPSDTFSLTSTGGWQIWKTTEFQSPLPKGKIRLQFFAPTGQFNLNYFSILDHKNTAPDVNAGTDQIITLPANSATLEGIASDFDGDSLQYVWTKLSGPTSGTIANPNALSTKVNGLIKGKYIFNLSVTDGTTVSFDRAVIDVVNPVSWEEEENSFMRIFPNPVSSLLTIAFAQPNEFKHIYITDISGRVLDSFLIPQNQESIEMDVSHLNNGVYIIHFQGNNKNFAHSFLKI